ncbi:endo-beta-N-acetylglucosaminidase [Streptomyces apocyni]|uniref:endo-beta-N-acetylglucosaminidase n=1 Tax=Streptomyces apocyni TaxID=2654677 RepID=UPI001E29DD93|nr:endo-beta-N-acetylglucosaminidase [Streptomyces apocyni]
MSDHQLRDLARRATNGLTRRTLIATTASAATLPWLTSGTAQAADPAHAPSAAPEPESLQPYASYWFPETFPDTQQPDPGAVWRSLKTWRPQDDPDLPFNTATVPLAQRFTPTPANTTARADQARVTALVSFAGTASNPSQGSAKADYYALTHWAYIDELVFWGGSSGEGIILAPNAPVIDAAHRHGVRVLGNVFLPPAAYGGLLKWTRELVQQDAYGRFPLADKLIQVARTYGFDGWFLNGETSGGDPELGRQFADFVAALRRGAPDLAITWYDAFTIEGTVAWQGALNDRNAPFFHRDGERQADTMFLDFRWSAAKLASSAAYARRLGRSPYELFTGLNVEPSGWNGSYDWDAFAPDEDHADHVTSYAYYRPEWTLHSLPHTTRTPTQFHARDDQFWSGQHTDPGRPEGPGRWRPAARHVADSSTVTTLPFATTFNTGHGLAWYEDGARTGEAEWNHLGLQDVLPARRWQIHTTGQRPDVGFDFSAAWHGGSSVLVEGPLSRPVTLDLFRTRLTPTGATFLDITHRADPGSAPVTVEIAVAHAEPQRPGRRTPYRRRRAAIVTAADGWTTSTVRLDGIRTLHALGVRLSSRGGGQVRWRLGALAVRDCAPTAPAAPTRLRVTASRVTGPDTAEVRLAWRPTGGVRHYEVHQELPGGARRFLGGTTTGVCYLPAVRRSGDETRTRLTVRAIGAQYSPSAPASLNLAW